MDFWEEFQASLAAYAILVLVAGGAAAPLYFMVRRRPLVPMRRTRVGRWDGREVWVAFLIMAFVPRLAYDLLDSLGFYETIFDTAPPIERAYLWAIPLATLLQLAMLFWALFQMSRTRPHDLGLTWARWRQNCVLGVISFVVMTPPTLGINAFTEFVYQIVTDGRPEQHPMIKLGYQTLTVAEWVLLMGATIVAVPILEEVIFRGVLQGWLGRASLPGHIMVIIFTLARGLVPLLSSLWEIVDEPDTEISVGPLVYCAIVAGGYATVLRWLRDPKRKEFAGMLPVYGSAMIFATYHPWPTPIPLFILGLALGYLALRTQSLLPGILLHSLFNCVTCIELVLMHVSWD